MPTGDAAWLALTPEPTLEPELPICDAHHHLWEFRPEPVPYQRYILAELAEDLGSGHNVRATVFPATGGAASGLRREPCRSDPGGR